MRLLIAGAGGMLGQEAVRSALRAGHEPIALDRGMLDIRDEAAVGEAVASAQADAVLNCAAHTDVDGAESDRDAAFAVNATGAGNLAQASARAGVKLLHVSTDYVFDGEGIVDASGRRRPYVESDPTGPMSVYGASKLAGERLVLEASPKHLVVRSSWLFGLGGRNFVETMLKLASERDALDVVDDQVGCPTWTGHLAPALIGLMEREVSGLAHLAGGGFVSWNGFAKEIFRQAELECEARPASTAEMGRPAPRPTFSAIESERDEVLPMPDWRDGLAGYLAARMGSSRP